ncbi:hydroxylase [Devosia sp. Leaf420]|uniref:NmrA family NAD(P)-binding protein n=1 Tax=Devosia sp. Leaf420 TaxID=1736374 RepID=UPI000714E930|nr:NmrA family NAD(P)-binding protein [Devosia sp. Leaf420]KQT48157.1 hydroxylase [Devosia sp. Leaf420]
MSFIIHGATGAQGAPLFERLKAAGKSVKAASRNSLNGEYAVTADIASATSLSKAYDGADAIFVHLPQAPEEVRLSYANNIVSAIGVARPSRVVISTSGSVVDSPNSQLQAPPTSAIMTLINGVKDSGISNAVVAPRLYLENLLLPMVSAPVTEEGALRYPVRSDYAVSWSSHSDVAKVSERLLQDATVTGVVGVGHLPGLVGSDLAAGFARHFGRDVKFESLTPQAFGDLIEPFFGPAYAGVVGFYNLHWQAPANTIDPSTSAQALMGLEPDSVETWLANSLGSSAPNR